MSQHPASMWFWETVDAGAALGWRPFELAAERADAVQLAAELATPAWPDARLERQQLERAIVVALKRIPAKPRTVLLLWCGYGDADAPQSIGEMAAIAKRTTATIYKQLHIALECLRDPRFCPELHDAAGRVLGRDVWSLVGYHARQAARAVKRDARKGKTP